MPKHVEIDLTTPEGRTAFQKLGKSGTTKKKSSGTRAAPGDGNRQTALNELAAYGYCYFEAGGGAAYRFRHSVTGEWTPTKQTYQEAVDAALVYSRAACKRAREMEGNDGSRKGT